MALGSLSLLSREAVAILCLHIRILDSEFSIWPLVFGMFKSVVVRLWPLLKAWLIVVGLGWP